VQLKDLSIGNRILALDQHARPTFAEIEALPNGPSAERFVHIVMADKAKHELHATLHHTFIACINQPKYLKPAPKHASEYVIEAKDIEAGDCLYTADGAATVRSAKHVARMDGDVAYSIKLAGRVGAVAIGGVFTHVMEHAMLPGSNIYANGMFKGKKLHGIKKSQLRLP